MIERGVVKDLHDQLLTGVVEKQKQAASAIRDLCAEREEYRETFASTVPHLAGLIDTTAGADSLPLTHIAAQALGFLAESDPIRDIIRDTGGLQNLIDVLKALQKGSTGGTAAGRDLRIILLTVLLAMAVDEANRAACLAAGLVPLLVQMLQSIRDDQVALDRAAKLVGRLAYNRAVKDGVRDAQGINALVKLLQPSKDSPVGIHLSETVAVAITILSINNELNQDAVRDAYGIPPIVKMLELSKDNGQASAAADAIRALTLNNNSNKEAVREAWALPLLVKLLSSEDKQLVSKSMDCLRILTTGNEANKEALFQIPSSLSTLLKHMNPDSDLNVMERAVAIIGNLSVDERHYVALREAGVMQRLVQLLEQSPQSRIPEIAAKTLANLAANDSNQTAIRLAGGIPPLMRLLITRPSDQVLSAAEEALRKLQVSGAERNAILDTLRYVEGLHERQLSHAQAAAGPVSAPVSSPRAASHKEPSDAKPFTRYTVEETVEMLQLMGFKATDVIEAHGITGGDLLELDEQELRNELKLPHLQAKKIKNLKAAFKMFNSIQRRPGKGDLTYMELQEWLVHVGCSDADITSIKEGFKEALGKPILAVLSFKDFAQTFSWFASTLHMMGQGADQADSFPRLPSLAETASLQGLPAREEQADGVPAAEHSGRSTIIDPAVAVDQHLQSVSGAGTTSNGDMQNAGHSSVPAV